MTKTPEQIPEIVAPAPKPTSIARRKGGIEWVTARLGLPAILAAVILQQNLAALTSFERLQLFITIFAGATVIAIAFEASKKWATFRMIAIPAVVVAGALAASILWKSLPEEAANAKRCLAIQRDMLSSMPLRSDDPDLFQALGCKAQGEGSVYAERDLKEDPVAMIEQDARRSELPYRNPYRNDGSGAALK